MWAYQGVKDVSFSENFEYVCTKSRKVTESTTTFITFIKITFHNLLKANFAFNSLLRQ